MIQVLARTPRQPEPHSALPAALEVDDEELAEAARHDRQAFAPLYDRYLDAIYRYCYRRLGSKEAAEDATTQIFLRALAALPAYRRGRFRSWLFVIAHNVVADAASHSTRHGNHVPLAAAIPIADAAPSPEEIALSNAEASTIRALLADLPAEQRHLLELRLAGLGDADIARVLGRSHGAIRVAQHRAIARLRDQLVRQGLMSMPS